VAVVAANKRVKVAPLDRWDHQNVAAPYPFRQALMHAHLGNYEVVESKLMEFK
jgi:hypothetical protein